MKHTYNKKHKIALLAISVVLIAMASTVVYASFIHNSENTGSPKNYPGTTKQEHQETEARKEQLLKDNEAKLNQPADSDQVTKQVVPVITSASKIEDKAIVAAYIPGIFEDGGTCTMVATKDGYTVSERVVGFANVSTTNCPPFRLDLSRFPVAGSWNVTISYESKAASGSSESANLDL